MLEAGFGKLEFVAVEEEVSGGVVPRRAVWSFVRRHYAGI